MSEETTKLGGPDLARFGKLRTLARRGPITLVFSAHDALHNDAVALRDFLLGRQPTRKSKTTSPKA